MQQSPRINTAITASIPINKHLKRYYIGKYHWLAMHNGEAYAEEIFGSLRTIALSYRADPHRLEKREAYLQQCPVRKNGWLRMMFDYLDSHPYHVLNFLKFCIGMGEPLVSVQKSANQQDSYLKSRSATVNSEVPSFMKKWLKLITSSPEEASAFYKRVRKSTFGSTKGVPWQFLENSVLNHTHKEFMSYWARWNRIMRIHDLDAQQVEQALASKEPLPEMYKDYSDEDSQSDNLVRDLFNLHGLAISSDSGGWFEKPALSPWLVSWVISKLNPSLIGLFDQISMGELKPDYTPSFLEGEYVGEIHHIPKKGTVKRRPIAVPNRFLQMGMTPIYKVLRSLVHQLPMDATFDQNRFDNRITNRVCNPSLYVGSVDLSKATDNLPFSWGEFIIESLGVGNLSEDVESSWELFRECSRSRWNNDGIMSTWTVGQPLGCLPSFMVLSITHNVFLEALSYSLGYLHSPYAILGDDVVIMSKKLRKEYIRQMKNRGIPLSLHKSYEGNLTEFAGKIYIRNHVPKYVSDHSPIGWENLFDYQRSTGVYIPYHHLPKVVRNRFFKSVLRMGIRDGNKVRRVYRLAIRAYCTPEGYINDVDDLLIDYFRHEALLEDDFMPDPQLDSGIVNLLGHPVTYLDYGYAEKHGFKQRYRKISLPDWFKRKFRPVSTDKIVRCATLAVIDVKGV